MEHTRENIIKSLRICARHGVPCSGCIYETVFTSISCRNQLMRDAAAMLEEIGKGELPRKPEEVKAEPTIEKLWLEHERLRGRAEVFGKNVGVDPVPPYIGMEADIANTEEERELKEDISYYEGFCDAAITVLEAMPKAPHHAGTCPWRNEND